MSSYKTTKMVIASFFAIFVFSVTNAMAFNIYNDTSAPVTVSVYSGSSCDALSYKYQLATKSKKCKNGPDGGPTVYVQAPNPDAGGYSPCTKVPSHYSVKIIYGSSSKKTIKFETSITQNFCK